MTLILAYMFINHSEARKIKTNGYIRIVKLQKQSTFSQPLKTSNSSYLHVHQLDHEDIYTSCISKQ